VEKTADFLVSEGFVALPYHAGWTHAPGPRTSQFLRETG